LANLKDFPKITRLKTGLPKNRELIRDFLGRGGARKRANVFRSEKLSKANFAPTSRHGIKENRYR
ncbi:MAG: hypothetical protein Q4E94_02580, partial [Clostridia bacterium]|nr:hypothetical protein [Clostridia bacterium]